MFLQLQAQCLGTSTPKQAETRSENTEEVKKMSESMCHTRFSELRKGKNERSRYKLKIVQESARIGEDRNPMIR